MILEESAVALENTVEALTALDDPVEFAALVEDPLQAVVTYDDPVELAALLEKLLYYLMVQSKLG